MMNAPADVRFWPFRSLQATHIKCWGIQTLLTESDSSIYIISEDRQMKALLRLQPAAKQQITKQEPTACCAEFEFSLDKVRILICMGLCKWH